MSEGRPPYALDCVDPARFADGLDRERALEEICATYAKGYALPDLPSASG